MRDLSSMKLLSSRIWTHFRLTTIRHYFINNRIRTFRWLQSLHNKVKSLDFILSQSEWQTWLCYFGILRYNSLEGCWRLWIESMGSIKSIITHSPFWRINNGDHNEPSSLIERKYTEFKLSIRFLIAPLNSRQKLTTASNLVHFSMHKYQNYK